MTSARKRILAAFSVVIGAVAQAAAADPLIVNADSRDGQSLDGEWTYSVDPYRDGLAGFHGGPVGQGYARFDPRDVDAYTRENPSALFEYDMRKADKVDLPSSWINHAPEMRHYQGLVWYQKIFTPTIKKGERSFVRLGAANYRSYVYLNGTKLGEHEGGFTPFLFEVTDHLKPGENVLSVGVDSVRDETSVPPPVTDWETYGGITRSVKLIQLPETFVDDVFARLTDADTMAFDVQLDGPKAAGQKIQVSIPALNVSLSGKADAEGHWSTTTNVPAALEKWSPDNPSLYDIKVQSGKDSVEDRVGFRTIAVDGTDILLNGEKIFLRGISMHEEEMGPDPSRIMTEEAVRALFTEIKDGLNGNFVRLAHYPHAELTTRLADEMGLLVWSEIPVYWRIDWTNEETLDAALAMQQENILRDRNRASIVLWSIGNETPLSDARNRFMMTLADAVRALDPTRLVTAALLTETKSEDGVLTAHVDDPLSDSLDVLSVNTYNGWYGSVPLADVSEVRWRSDHDKPMIFSELGAGAQKGFADPDLMRKFSEDYQAEYYRETLEMADHVPFLAGLSPWILKDFRSPRRQHPVYQNGWNRKGLISETGERKEAFDVLSDYYAGRAER
ncbi:glycoside hydrolase family 2 protein [Parvularcula sp. LCG005]|uniref:glycoside hydrolase family 2 protein n=1 Tax=Parvularcula sp. LCG005 TaxID=3078805 RepID=UPI002943001B|nr:glycoside hydrolase family 2 TIM barrel-domain containing protein [Parvularcula sp. LCG005]WOI54179.1 glycoside hydrolase family 2 TIM barrel-domain containing protein [Parvularcula sp. LCG005]